MALPDVSRLERISDAALALRLRELGLTREYLRGMTERGDDLRTPLTASRPARFQDDAACLAMRLFFCEEEFARSAAERCLGPGAFRIALDCGILVEDASRVAAPFHLRIVHGIYLFSDYLGRDGEAVMGAGETTAVLFRAARPRAPVERALDLGCGAGTLALLLAASAARVLGTDISPRAVALARFNAAVNGIVNADFRCGDMWAPVGDEVFDLIVSQPPYYPNATARGAAGGQVFLHGGERGDELSRRVVAGIPAHLALAGRALVFTSWPSERGSVAPPAMSLLELSADRPEVHGTRQSIDVFEHAAAGGEMCAAFQVAADCWGAVEPARIDAILSDHALLRAPREQVLTARLRLFEGTEADREGDAIVLRCPPEALTGTVPLDEHTWAVIAAVDRAPDVRSALETLGSWEGAVEIVEQALRRGLLSAAR